MTAAQFWALIDRSLVRSERNPERQRRWLVAALAKMPWSELIAYQKRYCDLISRAYRWDLWNAIWLINGGVSDDGFYYFRDYLVARGQGIYERTLADPESLLDDRLDRFDAWPYAEMHFAHAANDACRIQQQDPQAELPFDYCWPKEPKGKHLDLENDAVVRKAFPRIWQHLQQRRD